MTTRVRAVVEDLYNEEGKAEIVNGEIVRMSPTGARPGRAATKIVASLLRHEELHGGGFALGDNVGFVVDLPDRDSFSPDASWYTGNVEGMDFLEGAPAFAAEVRSKNDYGPKAERKIAKKRADYFAAGTLVVWDVDLLSDAVVRRYGANDPDTPIIYHRGEVARAEPAVPGWEISVDELFS